MKVVATVVLALALFSATFGASISKPTNDKWEAVTNATIDMTVILTDGVEDIKKLVSDTNYEIGQEVSAILDPALLDALKELNDMANEVLDHKLTAGQARGYFAKIDIIIQKALVDLEEPLSQLHPTLVQEIEDRFDTMNNDMLTKQNLIIQLLAGGVVKVTIPKTVDWELVLSETNAMFQFLVTGVKDINSKVSETSYEIGLEVAAILDPALLAAEVVVEEMKVEVVAHTLTAGRARGYSERINLIVMKAEEDVKEPLSLLHPLVIEEIRVIFETMDKDVTEKQQNIINLVANV